MHDNLYAFLRSGFAHRMDRPCLVVSDGPGISYAELDRLSACYARVLDALPLAAGDRVVAQIDKSPDAVALYLACLRRGLVYVPLNTAYTAAEVDYFLGDAQPGLLICRPEKRADLTPLAQAHGLAQVATLGDGLGLETRAAAATPLQELVATADDDVVAMVYTSGTTGRSKGAMLSFANLASNVSALHEIWGWRADDVLLHALPIFHVHGLFVALHCALLGGSTILFHARLDIPRLRSDLPRASVLMGVPTFYTRLLDDPEFNAQDCRNMRVFISGSAPLLAETFHAFARRSGHRILERYGMTEAGMIASNPLQGERIAGSVGFALPGVELRVVDENGSELPAGQIGQLEILGPNVFRGYWRQAEKTAAEFCADGYFRTGDLAQLDTSGRLTLVGRGKDLIIAGGYNIYPKEIEACLDSLAEIRESAVIGVADADLGEAVVALVVTEQDGQLDEADVQARLAEQLARFKRPRRIIALAELPRNAMGKVQKQQLRETYADLFSHSAG